MNISVLSGEIRKEICLKNFENCVCRFAIFLGENVSLLDGSEVATDWASLHSNRLEGSCSIDHSQILEVLKNLIAKSEAAGTLAKTTEEAFSLRS